VSETPDTGRELPVPPRSLQSPWVAWGLPQRSCWFPQSSSSWSHLKTCICPQTAGASWPVVLRERSRPVPRVKEVSPSRTLRTKLHSENTDLPLSGKSYSTYQSFLYPLNKTW